MTFEKLLQQSLVWRGLYFISVFFINLVISRLLQADGAGWIFYLTNIFSLLLLLVGLSTESGFTYYASNNTVQKAKLAWLGFFWTLVAGIVVFAGIYLYFKFWHQLSTSITLYYCYYAVTYVCGILLINYNTALYYSSKNYVTPNAILVFTNIIVAIVLWVMFKQPNGYDKVVNIYFFSILLQGILLTLFFLQKEKALFTVLLPNKQQLQWILQFSLVALAGNLLFFFMYKIDYWFVRRWCNSIDLGNYIQASKLAQMVLIVPQIFASVIFPQTAENTASKNIGKTIIILFRIMIPLFVMLAFLSLLFGNELFVFLFGKSFSLVSLPFVLLLPGIFAMSVTVLLAAYFSGNGKVKLNAIGTAIGLVTVVVADVVLIKPMGIAGAAIASSIGYTAFFIYALYHFKKLYSFSIKELIAFSRQDWAWLKNVLLHKQ
jgi:O-antigen/teichoic acid export membrane protein